MSFSKEKIFSKATKRKTSLFESINSHIETSEFESTYFHINFLEIITSEKKFEISKANDLDSNETSLEYIIPYVGDYFLLFESKGSGKIRVIVTIENKKSTKIAESLKVLKESNSMDIEFSLENEDIPCIMKVSIKKESPTWSIFRKETFSYEFKLKKIYVSTSTPQTPQTPQTNFKTNSLSPQEDFYPLLEKNNSKKYGDIIIQAFDKAVNEIVGKKQVTIDPEITSAREKPKESEELKTQLLPKLDSQPLLMKRRAISLGPSPNPNLEKKKYSMIKNYQKSKEIGSGAYGKVYLGLCQDKGKFIAVKEIEIKKLNIIGEKIKTIEREIELLSKLDHPNIVKYLGMEKTNDYFYVFMDYISGGTINDLSNKFKLNESVIREYSKQILNGIVYLHENGIIHRDIKGSNVLVDVNGNCFISDFGSARITSDLKKEKVLEGTLNYLAPELIKNTKYLKYTESSDIYAFGCTVYEMFNHGRPPYYEESKRFKNVIEFILWKEKENPKLEMPLGISDKAKSFLHACLQEYPENRKKASELLNHSFLNPKEDEDDELSSIDKSEKIDSETSDLSQVEKSDKIDSDVYINDGLDFDDIEPPSPIQANLNERESSFKSNKKSQSLEILNYLKNQKNEIFNTLKLEK